MKRIVKFVTEYSLEPRVTLTTFDLQLGSVTMSRLPLNNGNEWSSSEPSR